MASLSIRTSVGLVGPWAYGDPIYALPNGGVWGWGTSRARWIASGRRPEDWHGKVYILDLPELSMLQARELIQARVQLVTRFNPDTARMEGRKVDVRHRHRFIDVEAMERRGRDREDTLFKTWFIRRKLTDADVQAAIRVRP